MAYNSFNKALTASGLVPLGSFLLDKHQAVDGHVNGACLLVGNAGPSLWPAFSQYLREKNKEQAHFRDSKASENTLNGPSNPMDHWTRTVVENLAIGFNLKAYFPFGDAPYWPFLTWAMWTGQYFSSPLGLMIHQHYGLWSAFRAAFVSQDPEFYTQTFKPESKTHTHPCLSCDDKPCLNTCPVKAFQVNGYDVNACRDFVKAQKGDCHEKACLARRSCPVGKAYHYTNDQARYHMRCFIGA